MVLAFVLEGLVQIIIPHLALGQLQDPGLLDHVDIGIIEIIGFRNEVYLALWSLIIETGVVKLVLSSWFLKLICDVLKSLHSVLHLIFHSFY